MRIGIVGHFGGNEKYTDGQTVKVQSLYEGLTYHCPSLSIDKVDTYLLKKNPIKLILSFLKCLLLDRIVVFLPAARGRKYFFRLFYIIGKISRKKIYHDCIAGSLDMEILDNPKWKKYLNSYEVNWMESPEQVEKLKGLGIYNADYLPNFKHIEPLTYETINSLKYSKPYRFCTFSRVEPQKGIEDALIVLKELNEKEKGVAIIDVYGPVQSGSEGWFEDIKNKYNNILFYRGVADPHDSVKVLKDYFALLFPTQHYTEGMPGTIIDAMFAGLPVIARRWAWCDNMIHTGYNGISYDFDHPEKLKEIISNIINNPDIILSMKANCLEESSKYSEKEIVKHICDTMGINHNK